MKKSEKAETTELLATLSGGEALKILRTLAGRNPAIAKEIRDHAVKMLPAVDPEEVAAALQHDLELLAIEDAWDGAGESRYGYVDPVDVAYDMLEEVVKEYRDQVDRYQQRARGGDARSYCLGILKGLHDFDEESSTTPFKEYVDDAPGSFFDTVLADYSPLIGSVATSTDLRDFIAVHCPGWVGRAHRPWR